MGKILYDAGYGNMAPEQFVALLKAAGVTVVLDVRRAGCKSWNGKYNQGVNMEVLLANYGIGYMDESYLGNECESLNEYAEFLEVWPEAIERLASAFTIGGSCLETFCLICSEGKPFEADGTTPRCHRVLVAEALLAELGEGWRIEHL